MNNKFQLKIRILLELFFPKIQILPIPNTLVIQMEDHCFRLLEQFILIYYFRSGRCMWVTFIEKSPSYSYYCMETERLCFVCVYHSFSELLPVMNYS